MARSIFVVARQLPDVYAHLRARFGSEAEVDVIVDRRIAERRRAGERAGRSGPERRQGDRRRNAEASESLRTMGYAFVRASDGESR